MSRRRRASRVATPIGAAEMPRRRAYGRWLAGAAALVIVLAAWWAAGALARRAESRALPAGVDLSTLAEPARRQVTDALAQARANPRSAAAVGGLGMAYHASLLTSAALDAYALAAQLDPAGWRWTYYRGLLLEEHGRHDEAREAFTHVTGRNPAHALAWFRLGEMAFKDARLDESARAYERAEQAPPPAPLLVAGVKARHTTPVAAYAHLGLARIALERGSRPEALALLERILSAHPSFSPARAMRVQLAGLDGPPAGAPLAGAYVPPADPALDAVVAESRMRDLLLKHAALADRGHDDEWREFLVRRAVQFNPDDPNVLMEMAAMLQATGRPAEALEYLQRRERAAPGDHQTLVAQGRNLADLGRYDEAEGVLRRAARVRDAGAYYNLGSVLDRQGQGDEARAHYERAIEIDPFHARALGNLGVWFDRRGQSAAAIRYLARAVAAGPDDAEAYSNLGSAYIGARRLPDALPALETAVALDPGAPDAHNNLGIALAQSGRPAEAARHFREALRLRPDHPNARRNLDRLEAMRR